MNKPYDIYEMLKSFSKSISIDVKKLEKEMLKFNSKEVYYDPFNDLVVLSLPDGNHIYIKRMEFVKRGAVMSKGDKCKGCPYSHNPNCNGCGKYWSECYSDKKHKDFMNLLDEIDKERRN